MNWGYSVFPYATCPPSAKTVGEKVTLSGSATGGTPNYTITFTKDGIALPGATYTVGEGIQAGPFVYTLVPSDVGNRVFAMTVADSCATGAKGCATTQSCNVTVNALCNTPACNFSVI